MGATSLVANARLEAAIVKTSLRDGIHVLRAKDATHTAELVAYIAEQLAAGTLFRSTASSSHAGGGGSGYASFVVHKRKRDNVDAPTTWRVMLAAVPGMSPAKAEMVATAYPTMRALTGATAAEIAALRVTPPTGREEGKRMTKGRRIGPSIAQRIIDLI